MNFKAEIISDSDWEVIREASHALMSLSKKPEKWAIDRSTNDFLIEIYHSIDKREGDHLSRCEFNYQGRIITVEFESLLDNRTWSYKHKLRWTLRKDIERNTISSLSNSLDNALQALYGIDPGSIKKDVYDPNIENIEWPKDYLILTFDTHISIWLDNKRRNLLRKYQNELKNGKNSFLQWRFYMVRLKGVPDHTLIDDQLIKYLSPFFVNQNHINILLKHLDEGGNNFSEDTKRVLKHLRDQL